jgi:antitoxin CptB
MSAPGETAERTERRLLWRCRRGLKELDVLLERFARAAFPGAGTEERCALERLLERPDPELAGYLLGGCVPADPQLARLCARIAAAPPGPAPVADPARYGACCPLEPPGTGRDGA